MDSATVSFFIDQKNESHFRLIQLNFSIKTEKPLEIFAIHKSSIYSIYIFFSKNS